VSAAVIPFRVDTIKRHGDDHAAPFVIRRPLLANAQPYQFWLVQGQPSSGLLCGTSATGAPNAIMLGASDRDITTPGATDGGASVFTYQQWLIGYYQPTTAGDFFLDTDFGTVAFNVDNQTCAKLPSSGGIKRGFAGIFFGIDQDEQGKAEIATGPMYWLLARTVHMADNARARIKTTADGAASTTTAETQIPRDPQLFLVTGVTITWDSAVTGSDTTYATITVYKRDLNGANQTVIATGSTGATSATTNWLGGTSTAFKPQALTLSVVAGALNVLDTDRFTYAITKASTGTQLPVGEIDINGRVI
jgi:hypothetical protein